MTRTIPRSLAAVLEDLELEQSSLVTIGDLARLVERHHIRTPTKIVASRLRERGWLLPTARRGVWEFAPAALAGRYSSNDPTTPLLAFLAARPDARCALTFQAAAWAHGVADRVPTRLEVAASTSALARELPPQLLAATFDPNLNYEVLRGVPVLAAESVVVHMASRPQAVRSWSSALEWLPELARTLIAERLGDEINGRPTSVRVRTGYLLQGMRPDLAATIHSDTRFTGKTWFGPRSPLRRHDASWQVADTLLPFDPRLLEPIS
ncbi:hypothetical protein GCM10027421_23830 [Microbacterium shaanxiense]